MHEVDFLGKYLPEFGKLTCLVQHEFFHLYTADEHTLMCIQRLDDIWGGRVPNAAPYQEVFQKIERPFVLYLALLLHDAGKSMHSGHHELDSARMAERVARRLGVQHERRLVRQLADLVGFRRTDDRDTPALGVKSF